MARKQYGYEKGRHPGNWLQDPKVDLTTDFSDTKNKSTSSSRSYNLSVK